MSEADMLEKKEKYKDAIEVLNETIKFYPKSIDALLSRGADKSEINNYKGAIDDYNTVIRLSPENTLALYNIGNNYKRLDSNLKAISYYNKAFASKGGEKMFLEFTPNSFVNSFTFDVKGCFIFYERGLAYYRADSLRKAYSDFRRCIILNYQVKESYYFIGIIYEAYNEKDLACKFLLKSSKLDDEYAPSEYKKYCGGIK